MTNPLVNGHRIQPIKAQIPQHTVDVVTGYVRIVLNGKLVILHELQEQCTNDQIAVMVLTNFIERLADPTKGKRLARCQCGVDSPMGGFRMGRSAPRRLDLDVAGLAA